MLRVRVLNGVGLLARLSGTQVGRLLDLTRWCLSLVRLSRMLLHGEQVSVARLTNNTNDCRAKLPLE